MKLAPKEQFILCLMKGCDGRLTLDEIVRQLPEKYQGRKHVRRSAIVSINRLIRKLNDQKLLVERESKLGRANRGVFLVSDDVKNF